MKGISFAYLISMMHQDVSLQDLVMETLKLIREGVRDLPCRYAYMVKKLHVKAEQIEYFIRDKLSRFSLKVFLVREV